MNKRAQSIIEYALIAARVILGIIFMGPYVLRSIGAHFKLWDTGVQDSFHENLSQAPVNDVPDLPLNCVCSDTALGCGSGVAGSQCSQFQRIVSHNCPPPSTQFCDGQQASHCIFDPLCCTGWVNVGCGTIPTDQTPPSNNCNFGNEIQVQQCGNTSTYQCIPSASCNPSCLPPGNLTAPGALFCATNSTAQPSGLINNYPITYVSTCPPSPQCQVYCASGFLLNTQKTACLQTFQIAQSLDACQGVQGCTSITNSGGSVTTTNYQSFSWCSAVSIIPISVVASPLGQPTGTPISVSGDGCQNPNASGVDEGEPGDTCQIITTN